jgi:hypothetical protein
MIVIGNNKSLVLGARSLVRPWSLVRAWSLVLGPALMGVVMVSAEDGVLNLRAAVVGAAQADPLTIELYRWSTDAERTPMMTALSAPPPAPAAPAAPAGGRAGRGGRGGRGGAAAPPPGPLARLTNAVKAAPTLGYIWGGGPTGYSIKYAWHAASSDGGQRIVLLTDRRIGAHQPLWAAASDAPADAEFTVVEMRLDGKGNGEGKTSLGTGVVIDSAVKTLAIDGYSTAPVQLKVTR